MTKWPTKELKFIYIDIYKQTIWLTDSREVWAKCCEVMGDESSKVSVMYAGSNMSWMNQDTGIVTRLVGIFERSQNVLVHECTHAAIDICTDAGIKIGADQQEPFAYLLEYIYGQAAEKLGI